MSQLESDKRYKLGQLVCSEELLEKHARRETPPIITHFDWNTGKTTYISTDGEKKTINKKET